MTGGRERCERYEASNQAVVRYRARWVHGDRLSVQVRASDDEVERVSERVRGPADVLHEVGGRQQVGEACRVEVGRVVDVDVEIAADDDGAAMNDQLVEDLSQLVEELSRDVRGPRTVDREKDKRYISTLRPTA